MTKGTSRPARTLSADRAHQGPLVAAREVLEDRLRALELERVDLETALTALARLDGATPPPSLGYALTPKGRLAVAESRAKAKRAKAAKKARAAKLVTALVKEAQDDVAARARQVLADGAMPVSAFVEKSGLSRYYVSRLVEDGVIVATGATNSRRLALPGAPAKEAPSRG